MEPKEKGNRTHIMHIFNKNIFSQYLMLEKWDTITLFINLSSCVTDHS